MGGLELVHESLISSWRRLARWIEESREDMAFLEEAARAAELWLSRGSPDAEVWAGKALVEAEGSLSRCSATVPEQVQRFIAAGRRRQKSRTWRLRIISGVLVALLSLLALVFYHQKLDAEEQRNLARTQSREARLRLSQSLQEGAQAALARGHRLEARAQLRSALEVQDSVVSRALWWRLSRDPTVWTASMGASVTGVAFSPAGGRVAASCLDGAVYLFDPRTRTPSILRGFNDQPVGLAFSPDGKLLASASKDRTIRLWDMKSLRTVRTLVGHQHWVVRLSFDTEGQYLASASYDRTVRVWNLRTAAPPRPRGGHTAGVPGASFQPGGHGIATASYDRTTRIWNRSTGRASMLLADFPARAIFAVYSPDGDRLAVGGEAGVIHLYDTATNKRLAVLRLPGKNISGLAFHPGGKGLATSCNGRLQIWDLTRRSVLKEIPTDATPQSISFSPDGGLLACGYHHGEVRLFDWAKKRLLKKMNVQTASVDGIVFAPDGKTLISFSVDGTVMVWPLNGGAPSEIGPFPGRAYGGDISPDGTTIGVPLSDGTARLYGLDGRPRLTLGGHRAEVNDLKFSPANGVHQVLTTSDDNTVRLWDSRDGSPLWFTGLIIHHPPAIFTHNGWEEMSSKSGSASRAGKKWSQVLKSEGRVGSVSASGARLCLLDRTGSLQLWNMKTDRRLWKTEAKEARRVIATGQGCLLLASGEARLYGAQGSYHKLTSPASAVDWRKGKTLVVVKDRVLTFNRAGKRTREYEVGGGVTAVTRSGPWLVLGFQEGNIELRPATEGEAQAEHSFEQVPSSPVERLLEGPKGTLVAGFANGMLGIWSRDSGVLLHKEHLHGPVTEILIHEKKLHAASELGDHVTLDLTPFYQPYDDLLAEVQKGVPVVWRAGKPRLAGE